MAENSKIEWTHHTVNFWWGCTKVSPACAHCYAEGQASRFYPGLWGPEGARRIRVLAASREAMRYQRRALKEGTRFRVFTNSMADFFEDRRDLDQARLEALDVMRLTPNLDWLVLTKRPDQIKVLLARAEAAAPSSALSDWLRDWLHDKAPANVWLGTTVEDQPRADERVPALLQAPARVRFLSCEPLLGPVDLGQLPNTYLMAEGQPYLDALRGTAWQAVDSDYYDVCNTGKAIDWVIVGGESGPEARALHPEWARALRDQCAAASVPFLFKQWGEYTPLPPEDPRFFESRPMVCPEWPGPETVRLVRVGKGAAGRVLDGIVHDGYPLVEA